MKTDGEAEFVLCWLQWFFSAFTFSWGAQLSVWQSKLVVSCDRLWPSSNIGFLFGSQNHVFFIINPEKKWMLTCVTRVVVIWLTISISETQTQSWCVIDIAENFIWKQPSTFLAPGKYFTMSKMCFNQTYGVPVVQVRYTGCPLKNVPIDKGSINDS